MTPEGRVKNMVKRRLLELARIYKFMPVQNGMGAPGLDFYNCVKGFFVAIETKAPGADLTERQKSTAKQIIDAGGIVLVVEDETTLDEAMELIEAL